MNLSSYAAKPNDAKFMSMVFAAGALAAFSCGGAQNSFSGSTHIASSLKLSSDSYALKRVEEPGAHQKISDFALKLAQGQKTLPAELAEAMAENWSLLFD